FQLCSHPSFIPRSSLAFRGSRSGGRRTDRKVTARPEPPLVVPDGSSVADPEYSGDASRSACLLRPAVRCLPVVRPPFGWQLRVPRCPPIGCFPDTKGRRAAPHPARFHPAAQRPLKTGLRFSANASCASFVSSVL